MTPSRAVKAGWLALMLWSCKPTEEVKDPPTEEYPVRNVVLDCRQRIASTG
ncbi:hypothetical protein KYC5002_10375 [Archangium violaceum]|uniref:hypothetical protein n=1 Tax=Archangium violaceum TaxID=83451 RepID=UPI002B3030D5|nr:hypothetical protein KYC5002_10375 [Archangium gephyra]